MFFDNVDEIVKISGRTGCAVFVMPDEKKFDIPGALRLQPQEKSVITIDQVREVIARLNVRQLKEQYIIVRPAEMLGDEATNAFLKNLEEPQEKVHFILVTSQPSKLLPTVLSRAAVYFLKETGILDKGIVAQEKVKVLAKKIMIAKPSELPQIADEISKYKDGPRNFALSVLGTAIEMLYKTYFITKKSIYLQKIPKFLLAYESICENGHIKLHLVADLC